MSEIKTDDAFADFVASIADQILDGEPIDPVVLTAQYPEWAERLHRLLPTMLAMSHPRSGQDSTPIPDHVFSVTNGPLSDFRVVREIGRGGMGVVYEAIQVSLDRRVALKVLPPLQAVDPQRRRRFQIESKAAASLTHPHIVPVYAIGEEGGIPYFAMQIIDHRDIGKVLSRVKAHSLWACRVAELGRQAAEALHHAHQRGVIHRDIKPSNLLIDDSGWLWVADFGLALRLGQSTATATGSLVGTLRYMSPEQLLGDRGLVDQRVDIYALGASLYEWLTRRPAFPGDDRIELLQRIALEDPTPPRYIDPTIPMDLETIVLKTMAKDPSERYDTAETLAADLTRFLEGRPILARPPSLSQRAVKWTKRHKPAVAVVALFVFMTLLGLGAVWSWRDGVRLARDRDVAAAARADKEAKLNRRLWYFSQVSRAREALAAKKPELAQEFLQRLRSDASGVDDRGFEWWYLWRDCLRDVAVLARHEAEIRALSLSPDGKTLVSRDAAGTVVFWDLIQDAERNRAKCPAQTGCGVRFSPDGNILATWSSSPGEVALLDPVTDKELGRIPQITGKVRDVCFSPDSRTLVAREEDAPLGSSNNRSVFWDLDRDPAHPTPGLPPIEGWDLAYSPDGQWLATAAPSGLVCLTNRSTGKVAKTFHTRILTISNLAFSPDGKTLAVGHNEGIAIWDMESAAELSTIRLPHPPDLIVFSPDGNRLIVRIWSKSDIVFVEGIRTRSPQVYPQGISTGVVHVAWSSDRKILAGAWNGQPVTLWDTTSRKKLATFPYSTGDIYALTFAPDGQSVFFAGSDARVRAWNFGAKSDPTVRIEAHAAEVWALAFTPDGRTIVSGADDHLIKLWDARDGRFLRELKGHEALVASISFNHTGTMLATASFDNKVRLFDFPSGELRAVLEGHTDDVRSVAFSPDGRHVVSGGNDMTVRLWDAESGKSHAVITGHTNKARALAFDLRGRFLASTSNDQTIRVIDRASLQVRAILQSPGNGSSVAFSPDGTSLVGGDDLGNVMIWDTADWSRRPLAKLANEPVWGLGFSPDGRTLAVACNDKKVRLLDPLTGQMLLELDGHTRRVNAVAFAPDGRTLASTGHDGTIEIWRVDTP